MSDNIPLEIQMEIVQRIPDIKWVVQYRSVSKAWKSVIDSKDFVTAHTLRCHQAHNHRLLISTEEWNYPEDSRNLVIQVKYMSIVDDDTFPHQKVSVFLPDYIDKFSYDSIILGSSHGLFCLYDFETRTAVIWNPSIMKTVATKVPNVSREWYYRTIVGFGVCPSSLDPKLVKITYVTSCRKLQDVNTSTQVEVFTLSSGGTWRRPLSGTVPHKSIEFGYSQAFVDGFLYWDAVDRIDVGGVFRKDNLIMSFDLTSEEFTKINLPEPLAHSHANLSLSNLRESLAVLETKFNFSGAFNSIQICHVWQMIGHGCTRSFNKLYSIHLPDVSIRSLLGFRKSGAPIIDLEIDGVDSALVIYEPASKSITNIGIHGINGRFFVHSYMETLILLGH